MIFWKYPDKEMFTKMLKQLQNLLYERYSIREKFLNNGWKIIVLQNTKGEITTLSGKTAWSGGEPRDKDLTSKIIPLDEYEKGEDVPEEIYKQHVLSPIHKQSKISDRFKGYKAKQIKYKLPGEPEIVAKRRLKYLYQENKSSS